MTHFAFFADAQPIVHPTNTSYRMLGAQHGCVHGFSCGITVYHSTSYVLDKGHRDQEGFVILEGSGWAKVGDEEQHVVAGDCFMAPAGVDHQLRRDAHTPALKACWFHAAIGPIGGPAVIAPKPASYFVRLADRQAAAPAATSFRMLGEAQGCVYGCSSGVADYTSTEYRIAPQGHPDQEGFVVLEGVGWAKVGDEEQRVGPGDCFVAPAHAPHGVRRDPAVPRLRVCWFHGGIG